MLALKRLPTTHLLPILLRKGHGVINLLLEREQVSTHGGQVSLGGGLGGHSGPLALLRLVRPCPEGGSPTL